MLLAEVVVALREPVPIAMLDPPVVSAHPASAPTSVLLFPDVREHPAKTPTATFAAAVVRDRRALFPNAALLLQVHPKTVPNLVGVAEPLPQQIAFAPVDNMN
jgi:hypothetical protein